MATEKKTAPVEEPEVVEAAPALDPERKVTIKLPRDKDDPDVYVSVNEKNWLIKRGVEVEVPWYVAELIENSERAQIEAEEYEEMLAKRQAN